MNEKRHIVEGTERAIDERTAPEHPRKFAESDEPTSDAAELRHEQHMDSATAWSGPGVPLMSDSQAKGFVVGSLLGGLIGAIVLLPLGFIPVAGLDLAWRLLVAGIAGALAGGTAGAHYWGGRMPELEGETVDADNRPSVGSTPRDPHTDPRGR